MKVRDVIRFIRYLDKGTEIQFECDGKKMRVVKNKTQASIFFEDFREDEVKIVLAFVEEDSTECREME